MYFTSDKNARKLEENKKGCGKTFTYLKKDKITITMECGTNNKGIYDLCPTCSQKTQRRKKMENRYYLTGVQLGILMSNTDEKARMEILNKIMNDQCLNGLKITANSGSFVDVEDS